MDCDTEEEVGDGVGFVEDEGDDDEAVKLILSF